MAGLFTTMRTSAKSREQRYDILEIQPKIRGHYEKVQETHTKYFYVPSNIPSGIPGAFAVSEAEAKDLPDAKLNPAYKAKLQMYQNKLVEEYV